MMNLKDFQIMSEADDSYHMTHPSGRSFTVEKSKLSPKAMDMIKKMSCGGMVRKMANGGDVEPDMELGGLSDDSTSPPLSPTPAVATPAPPRVGASGSWDTPDAIAQPQATPQVDPLVQNRVDTEGLLNKQEAGVQGLMRSLDAAGAQQQSAYQDLINKQAQIKTPDQIAQEYKAKDDALMKHFMDSKVDPGRYVANASTNSKILAGIGMALSGLGAGANGRNLAFESINSAINNDIEAQKTDQSKKMNLWRMNRENMHDEQQMSLATQNQLLTGVQAKVAMAGANTASAESKLRASELVNQIEQQKIQNRMKLGLLTQGNRSGSASQSDPLNLVPQLVPPEHQKAALTEIGQAQAASQNESKMMQVFDQAAKENTIMRTGAGLVRTPPSVKVFNALADPLIHDNEGRINELEQKHIQGLLPSPGDLDDSINEKKQGLKDFINHKKAAPTAKAFGIDMNNFASTSSDPVARMSPQAQQYYQYARSYPNQDVSKGFFKKMGIQ